MEEMIAYCGLVCTQCPAYVATQNDDAEQRERVAKNWSEAFKVELTSEDINCDGCLPGHTHYFGHCAECKIRSCGIARGVVNCAYCEDYGCSKLLEFVDSVAEAKAKLEEIHAAL
ncbi:MAG: hypothetical protein AMJ38_03965 [Dehalococcoidia bacterium DG_22]|nr:MAG: hypothetical protein AMJ38_03965 [Dehalococcoidia bacterium DG_22]